jgi:hypothetical protein
MGSRPPQKAALMDSTNISGLPTMANYVRQILMLSDNNAYNRLYEFCGQDYINQTLWDKGYERTKICHRLSAPEYLPDDNRHTNEVLFIINDSLVYNQGPQIAQIDLDSVAATWQLSALQKGVGYIDAQDSLISQPFDFSQKNCWSLENYERLMRHLFFPNLYKRDAFNLTDTQYELIYQHMFKYPNETTNLLINKGSYPDNYVKFFLHGNEPHSEVKDIRVLNKVGWAYGYLTDVAYIVDIDKGIEFILCATIHVNENGIFNDNNYEYESIGLPFLDALGTVIYEYELKRARINAPDFNRLKKILKVN